MRTHFLSCNSLPHNVLVSCTFLIHSYYWFLSFVKLASSVSVLTFLSSYCGRRQLGLWGTGARAPWTTQNLFFFQFTLELQKVWQRICVVASPQTCLYSAIAAAVVTVGLLFRVILYATNNYRTQWTAEGSVFGTVTVVFCVWNILGTAERICAKLTRKTCLVPPSDKYEGQGQRSKVMVTRDKKAFFGPFGGLREIYVWQNIFSL